MSSVDLIFNLIGKDKTAPAFKSAGDSMARLGKTADAAGRSTSKAGDDADKAGGRMRRAFSGVDAGLDRVGKAALAAGAALGGLAIAGAAAGIVKSAKAASDLGESINAVNVTFGEAAGGIQQLGLESAKALGMSRTEFNSLAVQFSNFASTIAGPGGDVAATMDELTTRASDFASVMNLDVAEAATLFQSGLAGETEPLRKYGIDLSAAAVEAYALANGIGDGTGELTEQEKVMARYGIIMESTSKTAGDFANTQGSMANQSKLLRANLENFAATVGTAFTPLAEAIMPRLNEVLVDMTDTLAANMPAISERMREFGTQAGDALAKLADRWPEIKEALEQVAGTLRDEWPNIVESAKNLGAALERVSGFAGALYDAWKGLPPEAQKALALLAIAQKTGVLTLAISGANAVKDLVSNIHANVANVYAPGGAAAGGAPGAAGGAAGAAGKAGKIIGPTAVIAVAVEWVDQALLPLWNGEKSWPELAKERMGLGSPAQGMVQMVWDVWSEVATQLGIDRVVGYFDTGWELVKTSTSNAWSDISSGIAESWNENIATIQGGVGLVSATVSVAWGLVQTSTAEAWQAVTAAIAQAWSAITSTVAGAAQGVAAWIAGAWDSVKAFTASAWQGITAAIAGAWQAISGAVSSGLAFVSGLMSGVLTAITGNWSGGWDRIKSVAGEGIENARTRIGDGLDRIKSLFAGAVDAIGGIWNKVTDVVKAPISAMFGWINDNMIGPINNVLGKFSDSVKLGTLPTFHEGGWTGDQLTSREGLALLKDDEFVVKSGPARKYRTMLEAINAGKQGFGIGGPFDAVGDLVSQIGEWAMRGAGFAMSKVADPALGWLRDTWGGRWSPDVVIAGMENAVDAVTSWSAGEDSRRAAAVSPSPGNIAPFIGPGTGILSRPLTSYAVTSEFGPRWGSFHAGIDLGAPGGQPVYAAAAGKVMEAWWNDGYGNYIRLDHGGGLGTTYGHMSALIASAGQTVAAGQLIGLVGTTGDSTGDHLHFEVLSGGQRINPRAMVGFDSGGMLEPGWSAVYNGTGRPEPVLTDEQWRRLTDAAGGKTVVEVYLDGRLLNESLVRYRREAGVA